VEFLSGILGAIIGGAAALAGTWLTHREERRSQARGREDERRVASRAFRDDFYDLQSRLARAVRSDSPLDLKGIEVGQLGNTERFLVLAEGLLGTKEWSGVARARREYVRVLQNGSTDELRDRAGLRDLYWRLQRAREALALLDPEWRAEPHNDHQVMGARPSRFDEIDYSAYRTGPGKQVLDRS
jgi:hypothetical protein